MNTKCDDQGLELNKMTLNVLDKENYYVFVRDGISFRRGL